MRKLILTITFVIVIAGCSGDDDQASTPTLATPPASSPTSTIPAGSATATPTPVAPSATATSTPVSVADLPDGPLLALSPASGTTVSSQAVLIRGTIESGATIQINGVATDIDHSGDFLIAVAVGTGGNTVTIVVVGADGTRVTRSLTINRGS